MKKSIMLAAGFTLLILVLATAILREPSITGYTILPSSDLKTEPVETPSYVESIYCENQQCISKFKGNVSYVYATATGSMSPLFNEDRILVVEPKTEDDIDINSIIIFYDKDSEKPSDMIIHRVLEIGTDENGWYCITKGDNIVGKDGFKIRFENIKWIAVGVIW